MNRMRTLILVVAITAIASLALQQPWRTDATTPPVAAAARAPGQAGGPPGTAPRGWSGLRLALPTGWTQVAAGSDHVVWADEGRAHTVTLGATVRSPGRLLDVARRAGREFASELPGGSQSGLPRVLADGRVSVALAAGPAAHRIAVVQTWQRLAGTGLDAVVTLTSADGAWPVAPPGPAVQRQ